MRFQVQQVDPFAPEFADVITCQVASFDTPYQSIFRFIYPIFGHEPEAEKQEALTNLIELQRQWARNDPDSIWLKTVDTHNNNRIAAALQFQIHRRNPFAAAADNAAFMTSATWYPPGSRREYINACLDIFNVPHERFMQRPHVYLYIGFVTPEYRDLGVAKYALQWCIRRADELGLEAYLEAVSATGVPIFQRHGFRPYKTIKVAPKRDNADEEWKDMEDKMQPLQLCPMWRPKNGVFVPVQTQPPWDELDVPKEKTSKL
ncbi:hypothetical protein BDW74DRAFT_169057 [Aspergillus multicolor]|uniref:uncharacterized protein n=1 Tax=Aspergillus multicolor TaxID=41759 RepID=UPI003CCDC20B